MARFRFRHANRPEAFGDTIHKVKSTSYLRFIHIGPSRVRYIDHMCS